MVDAITIGIGIAVFILILAGIYIYNKRFNSADSYKISDDKIHKIRCSNCSEDKVLDIKKFKTNCGGFLCETCYTNSQANLIYGNYFKCIDCGNFIICFFNKERKTIVGYSKENGYSEENPLDCTSNQDSHISITKQKATFSNIELNAMSNLSDNNKVKIIEMTNGKENVRINNFTFEEDKCVICLKVKPNLIIPCESKPMHRIHTLCFIEYLQATSNSKCPICMTRMT